MNWVRIDNRLVHGQVIEAWVPYLGARNILVVNDALAADDLRQEIIRLAVPSGVELTFIAIEHIVEYLDDRGRVAHPHGDTLLLFATCCDVNRALQIGFALSTVNIGNLHYSPGKQQLCPHVALSKEDIGCLKAFTKRGIQLDFRCVPNDTTQVKASW
ncbi:MAG: PTS mannose/fructose/sorbose transporter subunit IIB [Desulfovibrionales bacterium]|nr:MAG: PTS mannose/fructose/sorbose transporter subunit IIB [Desulfovibrionales bacterium]